MEINGFRVGDLIKETPHTRVFRGTSGAGDRVILKLPATDNPTVVELARYQRAFDLGRRADPRAVVQHLALERHRASVALITEDWGAGPLSDLVVGGGTPLECLLTLGNALSTALSRLHATGIIHKDLKPGNILVDRDGAAVRLIDLGSATTLGAEVGDSRSLHQIEGTLAYMAPEQSGRVSGMVDDRADLYSLGVTLFELASGRLPFEHEDAHELVHAHVALVPARLDHVCPGLPAAVADIVARLLKKNPSDRYSTAIGVAHDLRRCAEKLRTTGTVASFELGEQDITARFRIPERIYGRDDEVLCLQDAYRRARGERVVLTVSGVSGIGKTALVEELRRHVFVMGGLFTRGRYDQYRDEIPYFGMLQAMRALVRQVLSAPDALLDTWRGRLLDALGQRGELLTRHIPELELVLGPQPVVEAINPLDATRRFHQIVARFLAVFASQERPLAVCIDDVQWADPPTLHLLEGLVEHEATCNVLLIVGYRSNEVSMGHPLLATLDRLERAADHIEHVELNGFQVVDVSCMVADTLHSTSTEVHALAERIHALSEGNPFFVRELLIGLKARGFFRYDEGLRGWTWPLESLHDEVIPQSLSELLAARLYNLHPDTLDLLDTASCVGSEFALPTLAQVHEISQPMAAKLLASAVECSLIVPLDLEFKLFESLANWDARGTVEGLGTVRYRFQHDRVRQIVHERLDDDRRKQRHLRIGRLLWRHLEPDDLARRQVEVFTHIAFGLEALTDPTERAILAELGLAAGRSAQRALAFETARHLLAGATELLPSDPWSTHYNTTRGVYLALAECAHALGDYEGFEGYAQQVIRFARTPVDAARAQGLRIAVQNTRAHYDEAVDIAIEVAGSLGVRLPRKPGLPAVLVGVAKTLWAQGRRDAMEFRELPEAKDPAIREAISLLGQSASSAYFAEPNLVPLIGITATRLSIEHGLTPTSPYGFAVWALVLCGVLGRIDNGARFGELALEVGRRYGGVDESRARFMVDCFVRHWREPLEDCSRLLLDSWASNRAAGDEENATYSAGVLLYTHFLAGGPLDAHTRYPEAIRFLVDCDVPHVKHCFLAWAQLYECLGSTDLPEDLVGPWYDHSRLAEFVETDNRVQIAISSVAAGVLDEFAGRTERATERFALALRYEENIVGQCLVPGLAFFASLNGFRRVLTDPSQTGLARLARKCLRRTRKWAGFAPFNLDHRVAILEGYDALVRGTVPQAVLCFHRALDATAAPLYEAIARQGLQRCFELERAPRAALEAQNAASAAFGKMGMSALADASPLRTRHSTGSNSNTSGLTGKGLDLESLLAAIAAISTQTDEATLLDRLMQIVITASGADRGLLLLVQSHRASNEIVVEVEAGPGVETPRVPVPIEQAALSRPVFDFARRTGETVVVGNAAVDALTAGDEHVRSGKARSILVAPMVLQQRTVGWLYLENHVARQAFSPDRVTLIEALGGQAAITLDNVRLYQGMQEALEAQTTLTRANRRFVPEGFLRGLHCESIIDVRLNEAVEREINVLFVDLRGFSALSIELGPTRTVRMINRYLAHVQPSITREGGFVGQYYGDGVLALFPDDSDASIRAAVSMCRGLDRYNRDRGAFPQLAFGMGLHSGPVTLGTIGDAEHFQCSVVGDSVNLASRMEGLTKHYGSVLVLSQATHQRLVAPEGFTLRPLGRVQVVGRDDVLDVFDCLDCYGDRTRDAVGDQLPVFATGVAAYTDGAWETAAVHFEQVLRACPDDQVSMGFLQRCHERQAVPMDWDGIERPGKG